VALASWAVAVGRWVLEPSEPRDPSGYIQIVCDDPNVVVTANGPGETLVLNNPGHSSVVGERLQAGARYRLTIARGADVLHTETVLLAAGERREVHIPPIILAEHTVAMKPSASSFPSDVVRMQISPDRSAVAVARLDGQILVFDAATGRERFTVSRPRTHCLAFGFTPDSSRLAYLTPAGGDEQVLRVVASADGHAVEPDLKPGGSWLVMNARTLAFSPDGARLTISTTTNAGPDNHWESRVFRFELTRGDRRWRDLGFLDGPPGMIEELRFTGDGSEVLAVSGTGEAVGWRWDSGQASRRYASGHYASIDLVAAGRNHEAVAGWSSEFKKASIDPWLPGAPKEPSAAPTSAVAFGSLAFSPDDQLLAAGTKGVSNVQWDQLAAVRVWAARSWKDRAILLGHTDWVLAIAFEPAGAGLVTGIMGWPRGAERGSYASRSDTPPWPSGRCVRRSLLTL